MATIASIKGKGWRKDFLISATIHLPQQDSLPGRKLARLWDSINILKRPKSLVVRNFYNHPEIKYLGSTGIFRNPSSFKAVSFSKTIVYLLSGEGQTDRSKIENRLQQLHND